MPKSLSWLQMMLVFVPIALIGHYGGMLSSEWTFVLCCIAVVPLAGLMGEATEQLAERAGEGIGGLLNATFGNAAELIIAIVALKEGKPDIVRASITGSIIGNILFVLGLAIFLGGLKREKQTFNATAAGVGGASLLLAVIAMMLPSLLHALPGDVFAGHPRRAAQTAKAAASVGHRELPPGVKLPDKRAHSEEPKGPEKARPEGAEEQPPVLTAAAAQKNFETLSMMLAGILLLTYCLNMVFVLKTHAHLYSDTGHGPHPEGEDPNEEWDQAREDAEAAASAGSVDHDHAHADCHHWSLRKTIGVLLGATFFIAIISEVLIGALEPAVHSFGFTETFVGVIVLAIVGNAAEHSTAVIMALRNRMNLAFNISVQSSKQIALFVAPVLVLVSHLVAPESGRLTLEFSLVEVVAVWSSVMVLNLIALDGESNWMEGVQLLALYAILAATFFFIP